MLDVSTMTTEEIATDMLHKVLCEEDVKLLGNPEDHRDSLSRFWFENDMKRFIRNHYNLWYNSELTRNWREHPESRTLIDGIDCSTDHPDNLSDSIFKLMQTKLK